jgi:hypothetical protein
LPLWFLSLFYFWLLSSLPQRLTFL